MLDTAPIKARLAAATPGPWGSVRVWSTDRCAYTWSIHDGQGGILDPTEENANLAASAPADLAALVAEVESQRDAISVACEETRQLREDVDRLRAAIATHRQEQGEAVTKSAADAADRRLWKFLAAATQAGV